MLAKNRNEGPISGHFGPNLFWAPLGCFWKTKPHSPVSLARASDLASHPPWPYTHVCSSAATATAWQHAHNT